MTEESIRHIRRMMRLGLTDGRVFFIGDPPCARFRRKTRCKRGGQ